MGFQTLQHKLADLIKWTTSGSIQLPDFQRGYVWDDERVRQLLVTIGVGHPLGVALMLETGSDEIHFQSRPIEGTVPSTNKVPDLLVLDGQQRLTSLTQAFSGDGVVQTKDDGERRYFIKVLEAVKDPADLYDVIVSLPADGIVRTNFNRDIDIDVSTREKQIMEGYFPVSLVFSDDSTSWMLEWGMATNEMAAVQVFINSILTPMKNYTVPAIELDKQTTMDAVTTVFEKVNQGGIKLTVFELLTAKFAGDKGYFQTHGEAFRLRDDWESIREDLDEYVVLDKFESDDFLQAVTLVSSHAKPKGTTARKEDVLRLTLDDYLTWAPQVRDGLFWAAGFLDGEHIHTGRDLPYPKQVVPLAALRAILGHEIDAHGVHARIRQWFWCGILGELYGSASETRFARDVDQVPAWARGVDAATAPRTVDESYFNESRLLSLRTRNSAAYKGVYALLMAQDAKDWIYNQSFDKAHYLKLQVDIHHIFPKAWCEKNGVSWTERESVVNKTPLGKRTNILLSGSAPSVYHAKIQTEIKASDDVIDALVDAHQIDPDLLWADDFTGFFRARRAALCDLVEAAIGKTVPRDVTAAEASANDQT